LDTSPKNTLFQGRRINSNRYPRGWNNCDPIPRNARWNDLVKSVDSFLGELEQTPQLELVSMCSYSSSSSIDEQLTEYYRDIERKVDSYSNRFCGGSTNVTSGMDRGISTLTNDRYTRAYTSKTMVVMTDGNHNRGASPTTAATRAREKDITIHTITFSDGANQQLMKKVAEIGNGKHWHAPSGSKLEEIFKEIARNAPTLLTF
ncbi:MAG: vWA domain-containing protein, partial [Pirellulales bacterium]